MTFISWLYIQTDWNEFRVSKAKNWVIFMHLYQIIKNEPGFQDRP